MSKEFPSQEIEKREIGQFIFAGYDSDGIVRYSLEKIDLKDRKNIMPSLENFLSHCYEKVTEISPADAESLKQIPHKHILLEDKSDFDCKYVVGMSSDETPDYLMVYRFYETHGMSGDPSNEDFKKFLGFLEVYLERMFK